MPFYENKTRTDLRAMYLEAWRKHKDRMPLEPVEAQIVAVIEEHPEYQSLLDDRERALGVEATDSGNPFVHLSLHLALRDQISIDRPPGIRRAFDVLAVRRGRHFAEHAICDLLAETILQAQRSGAPPDEKVYLRRIQKLVR